MKKSDKFGIFLLSNPLPLFLGLFLLSLYFLKSSFLELIYLNNILILIFSIIITELILRLILFFIYGKNYIYRLTPFKIVDNKKCGYRFKRNIDSKKVDFPHIW